MPGSRAPTLLSALLVLAALLAGCAQQPPPGTGTPAPPAGLVAVEDRHLQDYEVDGYYSRTLVRGPYRELPAQSVFVDVELPATSGGAAVAGGAGPLNAPRVHLGLFLPDVPNGTKVPVIADVGPYYNDLDAPATSNQTRRLGGFLIENFVPHGYAVAQVSVFGSGESNHCMDLMGPDEQAGIDAAVTWLGTQAWSNGKVGLIGRSYDGSTPWEAAAMGNPHLATIVPISGLTGVHELMWRNGTSETRGPLMHNFVYGRFGIDSQPGSPDFEDAQTLCQSYLAGLGEGAGAYVTGSNLDAPGNTYWKDRYFFDRAMANWNGSVYLIHGLQDWNVKPHMAFPYYNLVRAQGLEAKGLFGQWAHMYPDRPSEHKSLPAGHGKEAFPLSVRYDWAQDLLEWFDHYLKGTGPRPALHVEVQDNQGQWRIETGDYPPSDAQQLALLLPVDVAQTSTGEPIVAPASDATGGATGPGIVTFEQAVPLAEDLRVSGLARLHLAVTPLGANGQLYAELRDLDDDLRLGHAVMDLRYAAGDGSMEAVQPGMPVVARMEFEAMDIVVPAGHRLGLFLSATGREYLPATGAGPVRIDGGALILPTLPMDHGTAFDPPAWSGDADAAEQQP
jgi:predicted acyl esterase